MEGSLLIDKPVGSTSHDVVARIRRITGTRRVGHAGTLDPFSTGLLIICLGKATRLVRFLIGLDKEYVARVRLGFATDTQDLTGKQITPLRTSNELTADRLTSVLSKFVGPQTQVPPMFSAKRVAGERLHRLARKGREVERFPQAIIIRSIELLGMGRSESCLQEFSMRVLCSTGTYIRTLGHDIGEALGLGGHLSELRRTRVGGFVVDRSLSMVRAEELARENRLEESLLSPGETIGHLPAVSLDSDRRSWIVNGREVSILGKEAEGLEAGNAVRVWEPTGSRLLAVGEYDAVKGTIRPLVVVG